MPIIDTPKNTIELNKIENSFKTLRKRSTIKKLSLNSKMILDFINLKIKKNYFGYIMQLADLSSPTRGWTQVWL